MINNCSHENKHYYFENTQKNIIINKMLNEKLINKKYNYDEICKSLKIDIFDHNPNIIMPFIGIIFDKDCKAIEPNSGLYTQCKNPKLNDCDYCEKCNNYIKINKKLEFGTVYERFNNKSKKYRNCTIKNYIKLLQKKGYNIDEVLSKLKAHNIVIPDSYLIKEKKPRKSKKIINTEVVDTDDEKEERKKNNENDNIQQEEIVNEDNNEDINEVNIENDPKEEIVNEDNNEDINEVNIENDPKEEIVNEDKQEKRGRPKIIVKEELFDENQSKEQILLKILKEKSRNDIITKDEILVNIIKEPTSYDILTKEEYYSDDEIVVRKIRIKGITELTDNKYIYDSDTFDIIGELKDYNIDSDNDDDSDIE